MNRQVISAAIALVLCLSFSIGIDAQITEARTKSISQIGENSIRQIIEKGIRDERMPGCVVAIGSSEEVFYLQAFGNRQLKPQIEPMTVDTVFDLASLTKPIATATSVFCLIDSGELRLDDKVTTHWPEFGQNGKDQITIRQLLLHVSGLIADNALSDYAGGSQSSLEKIAALKTIADPGSRFIYSDVGFIVAGHVVELISQQDLNTFATERLFQPLQMNETMFRPPVELARRAAPAEMREGEWIKGDVHDPRSYAMNGIAGHAGLFSTASDLSRFAQMLLNNGKSDDEVVLSGNAVTAMTSPTTIPGGYVRAFGWDMRSRYSSNRGDLFSEAAFGHGGFTGTGIWIDPEKDLFVVFLSNRLHPDGKGSVNSLIGRVATVAAATIGPANQPKTSSVLNGIDILEQEEFERLAGKRIGLITNQTGINRSGTPTWRLLHESPEVDLVALFSPEHGFLGQLDQSTIDDTTHSETKLPVYSLYGENRKPTQQSLDDVDALVFDIQDIGTRYYTYVSTLALAMQAAAEADIPMIVLDRANPLGGKIVSGPLLDRGAESFTGMLPGIPVRHGLTVGEWSLMYKDFASLHKLDLTIVKSAGWKRVMEYESTDLPWINPSPNIRNMSQALNYPGIGMLEMTNLSVGRGTQMPFEVVGAPWIDGAALAEMMNGSELGGVRFQPAIFHPSSSKYANESCNGIKIEVFDREAYSPVETGLQLMILLRANYLDDWDTKNLNRLMGNSEIHQAILSGAQLPRLRALMKDGLDSYRRERQKFLRY